MSPHLLRVLVRSCAFRRGNEKVFAAPKARVRQRGHLIASMERQPKICVPLFTDLDGAPRTIM